MNHRQEQSDKGMSLGLAMTWIYLDIIQSWNSLTMAFLRSVPASLLCITSASLAFGLGIVSVESLRIVLGALTSFPSATSRSAGLWRADGADASLGEVDCANCPGWSDTSVKTSTVWALASSAIASAAMALVSMFTSSISAFGNTWQPAKCEHSKPWHVWCVWWPLHYLNHLQTHGPNGTCLIRSGHRPAHPTHCQKSHW